MIRCPLVLERMSLDEDTGEVLYRTRPSRADHPEGPVARWDVFEFIARVLEHPEEPFRRRARLTWAALIRRVYEIDPLLRPFCGARLHILGRSWCARQVRAAL